VDGRFLRTNWAGPRLEGGVPSTWWQLDLGPAHALVCNYYTLRHDASANFLRSWAFQVGRQRLLFAVVSCAAWRSRTDFHDATDVCAIYTGIYHSHGMVHARLPLHHPHHNPMQWACIQIEAMVDAVCPEFHAGIT